MWSNSIKRVHPAFPFWLFCNGIAQADFCAPASQQQSIQIVALARIGSSQHFVCAIELQKAIFEVV